MPSFDVVSKIDLQEVRNAVDQASREVHTRFDFKGTESIVELQDGAIKLESSTEDRLSALVLVLEEKLVRRKVSLKSLDWGKVEEASGARSRQFARLQAGIDSERARSVNRTIKDLGLKSVQSQTQGDQVRVTGKKRDALQEVIAALKAADLGIPLQFNNFQGLNTAGALTPRWVRRWARLLPSPDSKSRRATAPPDRRSTDEWRTAGSHPVLGLRP